MLSSMFALETNVKGTHFVGNRNSLELSCISQTLKEGTRRNAAQNGNDRARRYGNEVQSWPRALSPWIATRPACNNTAPEPGRARADELMSAHHAPYHWIDPRSITP